jgi:hypothetical protein
MSIRTQTIGQSVLDNIVRFKDLITGSALTVGTKYTFEQNVSQSLEERRLETNKKAPMRFIFRNTATQAMIKISSFDFYSFLYKGNKFDEYFESYPSPVETQIAAEFVIDSIKHQLVDRTFTDKDDAETDLMSPKYRYPLYYYLGYEKYTEKKTKLMDKAKKRAGVDTLVNFRMPSEEIEKCRKSGIPESSIGKHFKELDLNHPLLWQDAAQVASFKKSLVKSN